jgi:hypothetical protein
MLTTAAALLSRAQQAGEVRPGLDVREVLTLANALALAADNPTAAVRLLDLVRHGMAEPAEPRPA